MEQELTAIMTQISLLSQELGEQKRRLKNMVREGVIFEVDHKKALVRVESGKLKSTWLPFFAKRAGKTSEWDPPEIGEQCVMFSPGGELGAAIVLSGLYSNAMPPPSNKEKTFHRKTSDDSEIIYDEKTSTLTIKNPGKLNLKIEGKSLDINSEKVSIKNSKGELISLFSEALEVIANSKTPTMMGPREAIEDKAQLPPIKTKLDSFKG